MEQAPFKTWEDDFPVKRRVVHFNHAGVCPLPARVAEAVAALAADQRDYGTQHYSHWQATAARGRQRLADLIGAADHEVAYVKNTSAGLIIAAESIPWIEGDNVVVGNVEFPANIYPWLALSRRQVETRLVAARDGYLSLDDYAAAIDDNTRAVAVSWVQFATGQRLDLAALAEMAHGHGAYLVVDAIQGLGALEISAGGLEVDFLAADGHKWLLSVEGCGVLYVSDRIIGDLEPFWVGWTSVCNAMDFLDYCPELLPDARRFEEGTLNMLGAHALDAAAGLLLEVGPARIERRIIELTDRFIEGLRALECEVVSPVTPQERSGIVCFRHAAAPSGEIVAGLGERGIEAADRLQSVRLSPHFYNDEDEVDRCLAAVGEIIGR